MTHITISHKRYQELYEAEAELLRLECAGVDNWSGFSEGELTDEYPSLEESMQQDDIYKK